MKQLSTALAGNLDYLILALVFLGVLLLTVALGLAVISWVSMRRRLAVTTIRSRAGLGETESIRWRSGPDFLKGLVPTDEAQKSELTRLLHSAGFYGTGAVAWFQGIRILSGIMLGMLTAMLYGRIFPDYTFVMMVIAITVMTFSGYILPRALLSIRRDRLLEQYRLGFPDFLDVQVVCIGAGASLDSAIHRAGSEFAQTHPDLARNLGLLVLELRAGKSSREALNNMAERLGIAEARSYARAVQQSEEFGTSLTNSLRIYSDEMRQKRLARAEEKAHALQVKLVMPMAVFIFPVVLAVVLMPVVFKMRAFLGQ